MPVPPMSIESVCGCDGVLVEPCERGVRRARDDARFDAGLGDALDLAVAMAGLVSERAGKAKPGFPL